MANGQNQPWGLKAVRTIGSATWNGQTNPYLIAPAGVAGTPAVSIFKGDPVYLNAQGYISSIFDGVFTQGIAGTAANYPILGVFDGCSYRQFAAQNPIDPASPGRQYWPWNTSTPQNLPAIAYIIDDPNTVYNIQSSGILLTQGQARLVGNLVSPGNNGGGNQSLGGNTSTGQSYCAVNPTTVATANNPTGSVKMLGLSNVPIPATATQYNNGEFIIQNSFFISRPASVN